MPLSSPPSLSKHWLATVGLAVVLGGCTAPPPPSQQAPVTHARVVPAVVQTRPQESYVPAVELAPMPPVVSVYIEPPVEQPPPVLVPVAPPPMLVEVPPPAPFPLAVWTGGYWAWHGGWIWSAGRWLTPPQPHYVWVQPYYEHRSDAVVFVGAHWAPPNVVFVPPPATLQLTVSAVIGSFGGGPAPVGPQGVFVPPPPGSRWGLIVPAPVGTPPAVVSSAPPIVQVGMRVESRASNVHNLYETNSHNSTVIGRRVTNNITNVNNITNIRNVTIVAPAGSTADGHAFQALVPASAHLAAARPAFVRAEAPRPLTERAVPAFRPGEKLPALPAAQPVRVTVPGHMALEKPRSNEPEAAHLPATQAEARETVQPGGRAQNADRRHAEAAADTAPAATGPKPLETKMSPEKSPVNPKHAASPLPNASSPGIAEQEQVERASQQHADRQAAARMRQEAATRQQSGHVPDQRERLTAPRLAERAAMTHDSAPHHADAERRTARPLPERREVHSSEAPRTGAQVVQVRKPERARPVHEARHEDGHGGE